MPCGIIFAALFFLVIGLINVFSPNTGWYLSTGWRFRDAEPSDLALFMHRFGGFVALAFFVLSVVLSFISLARGL